MNIFKWIQSNLVESPIIWLVTEEMVQEESAQTIDCKLTDKELQEFFELQFEDDELDWNRMVMIRTAIEKVVNKK